MSEKLCKLIEQKIEAMKADNGRIVADSSAAMEIKLLIEALVLLRG